MIEQVEIRDINREIVGIIDDAKSIIWQSQYYGVGTFEIYVPFRTSLIELISLDCYVTRLDNEECGIIEHIEITENEQDGKMIIISGRFAKSILDRRVIYSAKLTGTGNNYIWSCEPTVLSGNLEKAVRDLVYKNAINAEFIDSDGLTKPNPERNIDILELEEKSEDELLDINITVRTSEEEEEETDKQVTYKNLLEYSDSILQEYLCGSKMLLDLDRLKFIYKIYQGDDRSVNSKNHEPIIFSKEYDNMLSNIYKVDNTLYKTTALIGGEGEGVDRKCAFSYAWLKGLSRRETFIDASSITQDTADLESYRKRLEAQGQQEIITTQNIEEFTGEVIVLNSNYKYGLDYQVGDIVTLQNTDLGVYVDTRIVTVTEVQDDNGYNINIIFGN